jgi:hypothetical protein
MPMYTFNTLEFPSIRDINNADQIVGSFLTHGFLMDLNTGLVTLIDHP